MDYDTNKVFRWGVEQLKENKRQVEDMSVGVEEVLNDYIHEHWSNVLWVKSTDDLRKQSSEPSPWSYPKPCHAASWVARYETDLKRAYLIPKPLKSWCGSR